MLLELASLIRTPGSAEPFSLTLDFSDMDFGSCKPVQEPVTASGQIKNTAGVLQLEGELQTCLHGVCDRCAKPFLRQIHIPVHAVLETDPDSAEPDDLWTFPVSGTHLDPEEILRTAFVLNMDSKLLCKEDCKGVCCGCGADLNLEQCTCKKEIDPRFAVLSKLLKQ